MMRIVFMGSPEFAVPSLRAIDSSFELVAVVTQPDRRGGRGRKPRATAVKKTALELGTEVFQPERVSQTDFTVAMRELAPDAIVVVAFGQKIPPELIELPRYGCINLHASLLPRYRGACPIHWAVINGERETGLTTMFINEEWDAGDIILQERVPIGREDTAGSLHDRLAGRGAGLLVRTLRQVAAGENPRRRQNPEEASTAPRLRKDDARINWEMPAGRVRNLVRGLNPWPGAFTFYAGVRLKVYRAGVIERRRAEAEGYKLEPPAGAEPGTVLGLAPGDGIVVRAGEERELLILEEVQPESRSRMSGGDFARGYRVRAGDRFESHGG